VSVRGLRHVSPVSCSSIHGTDEGYRHAVCGSP
jgi:hypothetical protein